MDGARGDGAQKVTHTFDKWFEAIRKAQGDIAIFSAEPTNVRWIGNEKGCRRSGLAKVNPDKIRNNPSNSYLNHGDPEGKQYSVGEADVSIRSGWFYHDNQEPKSLRELMDIYFKSVGRGTSASAQYSTQSRRKICGCRCGPFERIPSDLGPTLQCELCGRSFGRS